MAGNAGRSVLVAVDNSANADHALKFYLDNLHRDGATLTLLFVEETPHLPSFSVGSSPLNIPHEEWANLMIAHNKKVQDVQEKYEQRLRGVKLPQNCWKFTILKGSSSDVGHAIVKFAKDNKVQMILMGSRGLGTVRRTFLGSTSDYVLHHAGLPVLVVPPEKQ